MMNFRKPINERVEAQQFDKPCKRCGTVIAFSEGVNECPACHGKDEGELIELHKRQAEERHRMRKMSLVFIVLSFVVLGLMFLLIN